MLRMSDPGASKNACFALSCLAGNVDGHKRLVTNNEFNRMLLIASELLSADDTESGWFAAM